MKKLYLFLLALVMAHMAFSQAAKLTVMGSITDKADGSPIPGVSIVEKGTTNGTTTDASGNFSISVPSDGVLVFSFIGYKLQEIPVGNRTVIDVGMDQDITSLTDVVVVGYGTQLKRDITGAVGSVRNNEFKNQPTTNLASNIQGKLAGVNITSPSGTPGAGMLISIRGSSNPLYVVDGVPMLGESNSSLPTSFDTEGNVMGSGQNISSIADINPNDIESIEVLKDASATAIYGARAANGVILITTKRGKSGKTSFNLNYYTGVQNTPRKIKFMNSDQFVSLIEEARANDLAVYNNDPTFFGAGFDPTVLTDPLGFGTDGTNTVWLDEVLRTAPIRNFELSASGGSDKTKFFIGGTYFDQEGVVINSGYKRFSTRFNLDHQATDKLSLGYNMSLSRSANRRSFNDDTYTGIITNALGASPLMPAYDATGNYANYGDYQVSWLSDNPVKSSNEIIANTISARVIGSLFAEYKFTKDLKFRSSFSVDFNNLTDDVFFSPLTTDAEAVSGKAFKSDFNQLTWLNENILTYSKSFGKSNLNAIAGVTVQETQSNFSSIQAQGFPVGSGLQKISSAAVFTNATATGTSYGLVSYLARVNYDISDKYLFSVSGRMDGSSRFADGAKYGLFPSASAGWRISKESFFGSKTINDLKLRASYGVTGDQEIGNFQNISFWQPARYLGQSGLKPRNLADPNLTWQSNKQLNVGLDWEIMDGRFGGSVDYFLSNKTNLLSNDIIPGTTGFATITRNAGEIENKGIEFTLNGRIVSNEKFSWRTDFNISFIKSIYKKLTNDGLLVNAYSDLYPTHVLKEGESIGTFWAVKYMGVDPATGDAMFYDLDTQSSQSIFSGAIDSDDAMIAGKALPDYFGGLNNTLKYGNFDALIALQFSVGNDVYNLIKPTFHNMGWSNEGGTSSVYANNWIGVEDRWKKPGDKTDVPRASFIYSNFLQNSTQFVEDASFLRIRTVSVGYNLKPRFAKWIETIRIYGQVQNLYVFTKYTGFDPEVSSTGGGNPKTAGIDYGAYPQPRTFTLGLNVKF